MLGESSIDTTDLPPHELIGITERNVEETITNGNIPTVYKAIKIVPTDVPIGKHIFTITRKRRDE